MPDSLIIGIDPGMSGGLVALTLEGVVLEACAMPDTDQGVVAFLAHYLQLEDWQDNIYVVIEKLNPMPKALRGPIAGFKLGKQYGGLLGVLAALKLPVDSPLPQKWQSEMDCQSPSGTEYDARKLRIRTRAEQLFPRQKITKKTADAFVIAEYGRRLRTGQFAPKIKQPKKKVAVGESIKSP